ncbi:MAG: hypothetical protein AAFV30_08250 [Pseudomonadota bacterium]
MQLRACIGLAPFVLASTIALASEPLELPLVVETGQRMQVNYVHTKRQNDVANSGDIRGQLHVIDADSDPDNLLVEWQTDSVRVNGVEIDARSPQAADLMIGLPITYIADADLTPIRIFDRDDLMRRIFSAEFFAGIDNASREKVRVFMDDMGDDAFAQLLLKMPGYLSLCQGTAFVPGEPVESDTFFPSPIPGVKIAGTVRYVLEVADSGAVKVQYSSSYDPESVKDFLRAAISQGSLENAPSEDEIAAVRFEKTDIANCDIDRNTGWVQRMTFASEVIAPDGEQSERYDIDVFRIN